MGMKPRPKKRYVVCETVAAISLHLRELAPGEEPNFHGHTYPQPKTLCNYSAAWDTRIPLGGETCGLCNERMEALKNGS